MTQKTKHPFKTHGLTHIALAVKDLKRSVDFYSAIFGAETMYFEETFAQITTPGTNDIIVFEKKPESAGNKGGIMHFGFRLKDPAEIVQVKKVLENTKTTIIDSGEFVPGSPYVFFKDPDGYEIEIWYEKL